MSEAATPPPAAGQKLHAFEAILRMCARTAPQPWYPRLYAQSVGMSPDGLYPYLEDLWLDGLVQKAEGLPETGPGLTLTPAGLDVLNDPAVLQRLKEGRAVVPGDRGGTVREVVRRSETPVVTRFLFGLNVLWFLYTLYLAWTVSDVVSFLSGGFVGNAVRLDDILRGRAFIGRVLAPGAMVEIGDLLFRSYRPSAHRPEYALSLTGRQSRRADVRPGALLRHLCFRWTGRRRSRRGDATAILDGGRVGCLCGVIAAEAVWVLCNGRDLSRTLAARWRRNLVTNTFLIVAISIIPGVSGWCHLGGALTGAVVALVMLVQRFGPSLFRWAVLFALIPLPWLGLAAIKYEQKTNPAGASGGRTGRQR